MKRFFSLKYKLTLVFVGIIAILAMLSLTLYVHGLQTNAIIEDLAVRQALLSRYYEALIQIDNNVKACLYERNKDSGAIYRRQRDALSEMAAEFVDRFPVRASLDNYHMVKTLIVAADAAVNAQDGVDETSLKRVERVTELKSLLLEQYTALSTDMKALTDATYDSLVRANFSRFASMGALIALLALACLGFSAFFSSSLISPLCRLTESAQNISGGRLEGLSMNLSRNDEVTILVRVFNEMVARLRQQIDDIQEKTEIERQLQAEKLQGAQTRERLAQAELRVLQSRINPHFMFNTLNIIAQLAYLESAQQTHDAAELLVGYLRYSLDTLDASSTLRRELDQLGNYIRIQELRFGNRIRFEIQYDGLHEDATLPSMTLQPFIENAVSHGTKRYLSGGLVVCHVESDDNSIFVSICDNGVGMEQECLKNVYALSEATTPCDETRSIGIYNVCRRMRLLFGERFNIEFESTPGVVTRVLMRFAYLPAAGRQQTGGRL